LKCPTCGGRCEVPYPAAVATAAAPTQGPAARTKGPNEKYCHECGEVIRARAEICPKCGVRQPLGGVGGDPVYETDNALIREAASSKIAAGICGILIGGLGVHKFLIGATGAGLIMLLTTLFGWLFALLTCGVTLLAPLIMWVIGMIEGIIYLTKSDEDFYRTYVIEKRAWL
jgi:TM2 domain-containing membrane protein YozV